MKNVKKNFYLTLIEFFRFANCATWWFYSPVCLDMSLTDARIAEIKTSGWRDATYRNGSASYFSRKNSTSFVWDLILWLIVSKYPRVTCLQVVSTLPLGPGATHVCTRGWFYSAPFFYIYFFQARPGDFSVPSSASFATEDFQFDPYFTHTIFLNRTENE